MGALYLHRCRGGIGQTLLAGMAVSGQTGPAARGARLRHPSPAKLKTVAPRRSTFRLNP
jgi:hypothetical protein